MNARTEILELVGAIVLSAQSSEHYLKAILPFTHTKDPSLAGALARAEKLKRRTLGDLVGKLVDASTSKSDHFEADLANLVDDRNRVVHHFAETYGKQLKDGDVEGVITALRTIRANAKALEQAVEGLALRLMEALRDITYRGTPEFDDFDALCVEFRNRLPAASPSSMD
ncbi:hypothetical protein [Noviluteimonas dokdonensis]|uniref:hypothetical protein n=1 Tax=Noviluteimonas dokdonensis TaxID=414050 RepID=UPI000559BD36|nr:hypothetical protein [Lysobacter dokdonensis]